MINKNYVVIRNDTTDSWVSLYRYIFWDLTKNEKSIYINRFPSELFNRLINKVLKTNKIAIFIKKIFVFLFAVILIIKIKIALKNNNSICFILFPNCYVFEKYGLLKIFRLLLKNCSIIYFFCDLVNKSSDMSIIIDNYYRHKSADLIYTFDFDDAKKYNLKFHNIPYSDLTGLFEDVNIKFDISFVGQAKDRFDDIINAYKALKKQNLRLGFYIIGVPKEKQVFADEINYCDFIPYKDYLRIVADSKVILEIMQKGGTGNTIRVSEAISLDKLLISNNKMLLQNSFYDSRYMKVYENLDEIDVKSFIDSNKEVHYENKEKIYPSAFFKQIEKDLKEMEINN